MQAIYLTALNFFHNLFTLDAVICGRVGSQKQTKMKRMDIILQSRSESTVL